MLACLEALIHREIVGDKPAMPAQGVSWDGLTHVRRLVGFCGRGSQSRQEPQEPGHILAFSTAMRAPLPCVKDCRPCGGLGAILLQEGLGPLLKMLTSLRVPRASHLPLGTSMAPNPDSGTALPHP